VINAKAAPASRVVAGVGSVFGVAFAVGLVFTSGDVLVAEAVPAFATKTVFAPKVARSV